MTSGRGISAAGLSAGRSAVLVAPVLLLLVVAYLVPLAALLPQSVSGWALDFSKYGQLAQNSFFHLVFLRTFLMAAEVTALVIIIGYGTAYLIWRARPGSAAGLLALVCFPLLTSIIVRNYAWTAVLARNGVVNEFLQATGLTSAPLRLLNTDGAVLIGMTHVLLPFAILPIYTALSRIDPAYIRASAILGARPMTTFRRVTLPLSLPGTLAAAILVFILSLGFYITPAILGGPQSMMVANLIEQQVTQFLDFGQGAVLALTLLVATIFLMAVVYRWVDVDRLVKDNS